MRQTITIPLAKPLRGHDGPIKQIVLREPTFDEYLDLGDPYTVAGTANNVPFVVENAEVIRAYINLCLVEPKEPLLLAQAGARVAREVKQKLLGFFQADAADEPGSETSPTTLSSEGSGSAPAKSKD